MNPPALVAELCEQAIREEWVVKAAKRFARTQRLAMLRHVGGVDELILIGEKGLLNAALTWDPTRGATFKTHQFRCVWRQMCNCWETMVKNPLCQSLDHLCHEGDDGSSTFDVVDHRAPQPSDPTPHELALPTSLQQLTPIEHEVIRQAYWNYQTNQEIATARGCSREYIRQIHSQAVVKLRDFFNGSSAYEKLQKHRRAVTKRHQQKKKLEQLLEAV